MPTPHALAIELSERQQGLLEQITRKRTDAYQLVQRAQIVLFAAQGKSNTQISGEVRLHRRQVRQWRQRWQGATERLRTLEEAGIGDEELSGQIRGVLSDEARPGGPAKFSIEQIVEIVAVACEPAGSSERTTSHWTGRELADEVVKRGIVASISARSVGRFLKGSHLTTASSPLLAQLESERPDPV